MEREGYIVRRRKRLDALRGLYNPQPELCNAEMKQYRGISFLDKLIGMEDDGVISIVELSDLEQGTDTVIDFSDGVYEINSSVYQNAAKDAEDDQLRRLIADAIGFEKEPDSVSRKPEPQKVVQSAVSQDRRGMAEELALFLSHTGSPYAAVLAKNGDSFSDLFAPGFGQTQISIFNFPLDGEVYSQIISKRRTLIINSSFCELPELTCNIRKHHLEHISSCCFVPLGSEPEDRYLFFAFDSAVITLDNVKKIIKKVNNIPVIA